MHRLAVAVAIGTALTGSRATPGLGLLPWATEEGRSIPHLPIGVELGSLLSGSLTILENPKVQSLTNLSRFLLH
jgi:hypothetical protein